MRPSTPRCQGRNQSTNWAFQTSKPKFREKISEQQLGVAAGRKSPGGLRLIEDPGRGFALRYRRCWLNWRLERKNSKHRNLERETEPREIRIRPKNVVTYIEAHKAESLSFPYSSRSRTIHIPASPLGGAIRARFVLRFRSARARRWALPILAASLRKSRWVDSSGCSSDGKMLISAPANVQRPVHRGGEFNA